MASKKCPTCGGTGKVHDPLMVLATLGMSFLMGNKDECEQCEGKGWVRVPNDFVLDPRED